MYKVQLRGEIRNGKLIIDMYDLEQKARNLDDGHIVLTMETIGGSRTLEDFRRQYFIIRDVIVRETGNERKTVHAMIKNNVLISFVTNPLYLNNEAVEHLTTIADGDGEVLRYYIKQHLSTTWLNEIGWKEFIESTRIWAMTGLNINV